MNQDLFLNILTSAHDIVLKQAPTAKFVNFQRDLKLLGTPWIFTFRSEKNDIVLKYFDGTGFATPEITPITLGLQPIPLLIGLSDARKKINFTPVTEALYWALNPIVVEPIYVFTGVDQTAFVGAYDGTVTYAKTAMTAQTAAMVPTL
jgi:hypothetical protein